jgi:hypothetical protein
LESVPALLGEGLEEPPTLVESSFLGGPQNHNPIHLIAEVIKIVTQAAFSHVRDSFNISTSNENPNKLWLVQSSRVQVRGDTNKGASIETISISPSVQGDITDSDPSLL